MNTESLNRRGGEQYTKLEPGSPGYFAGQADQLRQLWESYFGRAVMQAEIVYDAKRKTFVFTDKAMDELLNLFNKGQGGRWGCCSTASTRSCSRTRTLQGPCPLSTGHGEHPD